MQNINHYFLSEPIEGYKFQRSTNTQIMTLGTCWLPTNVWFSLRCRAQFIFTRWSLNPGMFNKHLSRVLVKMKPFGESMLTSRTVGFQMLLNGHVYFYVYFWVKFPFFQEWFGLRLSIGCSRIFSRQKAYSGWKLGKFWKY